MTELSDTELRRLDLTLLLMFMGLMRHRKVHAVASDLGLTQSAVSQGLRRLRDVFGDELFLRRPHGMEPTAVALALEASVETAVHSLRAALGNARKFDPSTAEGTLRIAALDAEQAVLIPPLASRLRKAAPKLRISVLALGRGDAVDALSEGRVELALGFLWNIPSHISSLQLYDETFLVAGRRRSLPRAPDLSLNEYCARDHILVSPAGDLRGVVDDRLESMGRRRNVVLGLPAFLPALAAVAASNAIVTLPGRVAKHFAKGFGLVTATPPLQVRSFPVSAFWHRRNDAQPQLQWIRQHLIAIASQTAETP